MEVGESGRGLGTGNRGCRASGGSWPPGELGTTKQVWAHGPPSFTTPANHDILAQSLPKPLHRDLKAFFPELGCHLCADRHPPCAVEKARHQGPLESLLSQRWTEPSLFCTLGLPLQAPHSPGLAAAVPHVPGAKGPWGGRARHTPPPPPGPEWCCCPHVSSAEPRVKPWPEAVAPKASPPANEGSRPGGRWGRYHDRLLGLGAGGQQGVAPSRLADVHLPGGGVGVLGRVTPPRRLNRHEGDAVSC